MNQNSELPLIPPPTPLPYFGAQNCTRFRHQGAPPLIMATLVFNYFLITLYIPFEV